MISQRVSLLKKKKLYDSLLHNDVKISLDDFNAQIENKDEHRE